MTHREFIAWLQRIECAFPVADWKLGGIHVWPLIRLSLYGSNFGAGTPAYSLTAGRWRLLEVVAAGLGRWAYAYLADLPQNRRRTAPADAVFLSSSIGTQVLLRGRHYNRMTAPYVELLRRAGLRSLVWETSPFGDYNIPRHTPSTLIQPRIILERFLSQVLPFPPAEPSLPRHGEFLEQVLADGLTLPHADPVRLWRDVLYLRRQADCFARWLRRVRPRVVFVADTGLREQALCLACRELGITSVELQHGIQGDYHPGYGSWWAVPRGGYETRARIFWCWDRAGAEAINRWACRAPEAHAAIVGGDPWRQMWGRTDDPLVRKVDQELAARKQALGGSRHVLVTLSSSGDLVPGGVVDAIRRSPSDWRWWIRLHPVDQARRRKEAQTLLPGLGLSVELMEYATVSPLHPLLRHMDCHVTVGLSTVIQEAEEAGIRSVAYREDAKDLYADEMTRGTLGIAQTGESILATLQRFMALPRVDQAAEGYDAEETMKQVLQLAGPNGRNGG